MGQENVSMIAKDFVMHFSYINSVFNRVHDVFEQLVANSRPQKVVVVEERDDLLECLRDDLFQAFDVSLGRIATQQCYSMSPGILI